MVSSQKSVTITFGEHGYNVHVVRDAGGFYIEGLTWDECLGQVAVLTMPPDRAQPGTGLYPMRADADREQLDALDRELDEACHQRNVIADRESPEYAAAQAEVDRVSAALRAIGTHR